MAFVETGINFDDIKEKQSLPKAEYDLLIESAEVKGGDGTGKLHVAVRLSAHGHPDAKAIFHNMYLPMAEDDGDKKENKMRFLKRFLERFKIPYVGAKFDTDTFVGRTAKCTLTQEEYPAGSGEFNNKVKV